jgi:hypothetical protein
MAWANVYPRAIAALLFLFRLLLLVVALAFPFQVPAKPSRTEINSDMVLNIDGQKIFPIGFTMPPPPDGRTPEGKNGIAELAEAGATFLRTGAQGGPWDDATIAREEQYERAAARYGLHCLPFLRELAVATNKASEAKLRQVLEHFKDNPGLGAWKGADEPEWGKCPLPSLVQAYRVIKEVDPNHPLVTIQAPRGTVESLRRYNVATDITGADIYPVSYPPGIHSLLPNRSISLVGDHTRIMMDVAEGKLPVWMVLQISWSGVLKPGKTLRFPAFPEERFMTYEAIIDGARGLLYFGGANEKAMSAPDRELGWNWTFWKRVLRPVIEEIGSKSPLYPALVAADSPLPITVSDAANMEFRARQVGDALFLMACKRGGDTAEVTFRGLPPSAGDGEVLYEAPRSVQSRHGEFTDWFGPFEVHVYRFSGVKQ